MKIKTITCHNVNNYGASLQAYALMKYLSDLGHSVEIIDYMPDYLSFSLWKIGPRWNRNIVYRLAYFLYVVPKKISLKARRRKFAAFKKDWLKLTEKTYTSIEDLLQDVPDADIYLAGSDQIWNPEAPNGRDSSFFLDFVPSGRIKASYAASFSVTSIKPEIEDFIKNKLSSFDFISVRESSGLDILKKIGINSGCTVLDPVFLINRSEWLRFTSPERPKERYIFVYDQENNASIKHEAQLLAKKYNLKIYSISSLYPVWYADKRIKDAGPQEFIDLINNCEICITNSFHCIAFSIIFNKRFYLFKRQAQKVNSRMVDLLKYLKLEDRIVDENSSLLSDAIINYQEVDILINEKLEFSKKFINKIIKQAASSEL